MHLKLHDDAELLRAGVVHGSGSTVMVGVGGPCDALCVLACHRSAFTLLWLALRYEQTLV